MNLLVLTFVALQFGLMLSYFVKEKRFKLEHEGQTFTCFNRFMISWGYTLSVLVVYNEYTDTILGAIEIFQ